MTTREKTRWAIRNGRYAIGVAIMAYFFGLGYFLQAVRNVPAAPAVHSDAVVALTGGSGRIAAAVGLLQAGLADRLFISGVNPETEPPELARLNGQSAALFACCVVIGHHATNTIENAGESAEWIRSNHYKSLRLVTSDYHMPRALLLFRMALPGVTIIPSPVTARSSPGLHLRFVLEYTKYLVTLARYEVFQLAASP